MNTANDITEELNSLGSTLAGMPKGMPYSVPAGYFENLSGEIVNISNNKISANWGKTQPFTTPGGYFEELPEHILAAIKTEQVKSASSQNMPHNVPAGFFEAFPAQALQAAKKTDTPTKKTNRISLGDNSFGKIRWAAAAVLLICIGFGGYETFYTEQDNTENMLASVSGNEIKDYLQHTYILDVNRVMSSEDINSIEVDNKDIIQYLNDTGWDVIE